jgi:single-strand DNA-binding protein
MTTLTVTGNLTSDPELKFIPNGKAVASFTVAASKSVKNADGSWENTDTTFWTVKAWGKTAENVTETLRKGMSVIVVGSATQENWEDKKTGEKKNRIVITAFNVGVDLKRHSASVTQITRSDSQFVSTPPDADPWNTKFHDAPPF